MFAKYWAHIKCFIAHAKAIAFVGIVSWLLAALTLDMLGLIDIEVDCAICGRLIDRVIPDAMASTTPIKLLPESVPPFVTVRLTVLP